ncbi:hypothetical protein GCM10009554_26510 [Kribbella koreensis]|uniref:DUF3040 domain-containing protein n=3 Tax=Kribbellaceae TaxID=2726069 RepID=A0ABP6W5W6_9ACTN
MLCPDGGDTPDEYLPSSAETGAGAAVTVRSCRTVTRGTGSQGFVDRMVGLDWTRPIEIALTMEGSTVPLSEEEQRQFEQLERALAAEDPKFVSAMRGTNVRLYYKRRAVLAGVGFVLGIAILMAGAIIPNTIIGVIGFVVMVACLYIAALSMKRISNASDGDDLPPPPPQSKRHRTRHDSSGSFMERMEDRWRRRRDEDL